MSHKHFSEEFLPRLRSEQRISFLDPESVISKCIEIAGIKSGPLLDIGTGTGLFAEHFQKKGFQVTGIDDSDEMLREAQKLVPSANFIQATADNLPFEDKTFDFSLMAYLLHEVDDCQVVLREAKRVTKHHVLIFEWCYQKEEIGPPLEHRMKPTVVEELFLQAGLGKCHSEKINNTMLYLSQIEK